MKSTATATLAATALWLSATIATLPALAQDGDLGLDLVTAEEILASDEARGISPDETYPPYQPADGDADGEAENGFAPPGEGLDPTPSELEQWAAAAAAVLLVPGFVRLGDWPMISRAIPGSWSGYARPSRVLALP